MFPIKLTEGISPWHQKCQSFETEQQQVKHKVKRTLSSEKSLERKSSSSGRHTPQLLQSQNSTVFHKLLKRRLSNAGCDLERFQKLHLPRTVSMKKPIQQRKVLEEVTLKQFIVLGEKPVQMCRRKESFRTVFMIKHKLKKQIQKQNLQKKKM